MIRLGLILLCFTAGMATTAAQQSNRQIKQTANRLFAQGNYSEALNLYLRYTQYETGDSEALRNLGICQFETNLIDQARETLQRTLTDDRMAKDDMTLYYMGELLFHQQDYAKAAIFYKSYLFQTRASDKKREVLHKLSNCEYAQDLSYLPRKGFIENLGLAVNSTADDVMPKYSMNVSDKIYFASNYDRQEQIVSQAVKSHDMYSSTLTSGEWSEASKFPLEFSTSRNEFPLAFINNGQNLIFQRGGLGEASLLVDTFRNSEQTTERQFGKWDAPFYPELGDRTINFYGTDVVFFSSSRPGGFGGMDIYYSIKKIDGWSAPVNLGPAINSRFDEIDPFISNSGDALYFSSNREESFGGFDIFSSTYNRGKRTWDAAVNAGAPMNSPADEINMVIDPSGNSYLLASNRKTGYGGYDLYLVYATSPIQDMMYARASQPLQFLKDNVVRADSIAQIPVATETPIPVEPVIEKEVVFNKMISISPVYYSAQDVVLNPQSIKTIDKLANLIQQYPALKINLVAHSAGYDGPKYFDLYFSTRRAAEIIQYLRDKNCSVENISITGIGEQFPYAAASSNNDIVGFSDKLNRRIDIYVDGSMYELGFPIADGGLDDQFVDSKHSELKQLLRGTTYKVVVKSTSQLFKDDIMLRPGTASVEQSGADGTYHYTVGWSRDQGEMDQLAKQLRKEGYGNASVVRYDGGVRED